MPLCTRGEMFHKHPGLRILFLLASSWVASGQSPLPLPCLEISSDHLIEGESIKMSCVAPRAYVGAYFYLFMEGQTQPVQVLAAGETQYQVSFLLENITTSQAGLYRCQYGVLNGSRLLPSAPSHTAQIMVEAFGLSTFPPTGPPGSGCQDPPWSLLAALTVTGVLLLVMILVVAALALGRLNERRRQKKKELDSCWTEGRHCATELSFDNGVFTVSPKRDQDTAEIQDAKISSGRGFRLTSDSDSCLEQPDFFTFKASK